ncbi:alkaline phosphatase family protein [Desulfosarcina cetonica]|uniref:alkaline phosphatase family protein n=1 Tax=Desulfosarcina cetonica TaxID=90730 RepID=UPI00278BBFA1|nr:alkaline phosphatase family protein [Desulfosarcina cetonica]
MTEILTPKRRHRKNAKACPSSDGSPKAVLLFTMDQCRADYLTNPQICPAFAFTRSVLMRQGASYANAMLSYAGSRTAVSHTVIGTGATPGINGIIGNNIRSYDEEKSPIFPLAYNGSPRHSMDMFNLLTPTLADVMDLDMQNLPIVISMSPYGRAALGMGGHGAAYMEGRSDNDIVLKLSRDLGLPYTNPTYFSLPDYLTHSDANPIRIDDWLLANYGIDISSEPWTEHTIIKDNSPFAPKHGNVIVGPQGVFPDGETFSFSYAAVTSDVEEPSSTVQLWSEAAGYKSNTYFEEAMYTPFYTLWATDMLLMAIQNEGVGQDAITDLVYYNFKCLDKLGHRYGVNSPELYTYMYTVDYCLRKIKGFLDRKIGAGRYTMVVTADHGGHNAYDGRILYNRNLFKAIEDKFGSGIIQNNPDNGDPFDDMIYLNRNDLPEDTTLDHVARFVEDEFGDYVYRAFTIDEIFR